MSEYEIYKAQPRKSRYSFSPLLLKIFKKKERSLALTGRNMSFLGSTMACEPKLSIYLMKGEYFSKWIGVVESGDVFAIPWSETTINVTWNIKMHGRSCNIWRYLNAVSVQSETKAALTCTQLASNTHFVAFSRFFVTRGLLFFDRVGIVLHYMVTSLRKA